MAVRDYCAYIIVEGKNIEVKGFTDFIMTNSGKVPKEIRKYFSVQVKIHLELFKLMFSKQ